MTTNNITFTVCQLTNDGIQLTNHHWDNKMVTNQLHGIFKGVKKRHLKLMLIVIFS